MLQFGAVYESVSLVESSNSNVWGKLNSTHSKKVHTLSMQQIDCSILRSVSSVIYREVITVRHTRVYGTRVGGSTQQEWEGLVS